MPSADQVPVNSTHSMMRWHKWVVLIAGSTGSALRAVCPFQPSHHAGCSTRSRLCRKRDGFLVALAPGHHVAQAMRAILLASAMAATLVGRRANNAVSQGRCLVPWILAYRMTASAPATNR